MHEAFIIIIMHMTVQRKQTFSIGLKRYSPGTASAGLLTGAANGSPPRSPNRSKAAGLSCAGCAVGRGTVTDVGCDEEATVATGFTCDTVCGRVAGLF